MCRYHKDSQKRRRLLLILGNKEQRGAEQEYCINKRMLTEKHKKLIKFCNKSCAAVMEVAIYTLGIP